MVPIELAWLGCAHRGQNALGIPAEDGAVRHVGEACDRQRSRSHGVCEVIVRRRLRRDPGLAAMRMYIDGNGLAQDIERSSGGLGRPGGGCRAAGSNLAGEHRVDRNQRRAAHPVSRREGVPLTAAIHAVLPRMAALMPGSGHHSARNFRSAMRDVGAAPGFRLPVAASRPAYSSPQS